MNLKKVTKNTNDNWLKDEKIKNSYLIDNDLELRREVSKLRMKETMDTKREEDEHHNDKWMTLYEN